MTLLEPQKSLAHLIYIGFPGEASSAFRITRRRRQDKKRQRTQRVVFQVYIFGASKSGKSALLNALVGRPYSEASEHTKGVHIAANVVEQIGGSKKTLILREINGESVASFLEKKDAMADCDVAAFVYDSSDAASWNRACELLVEVAARGEITGQEVPCLVIATKDDLEPDSSCKLNATRVCTEMGVDAPMSVSMKLGDITNFFRRIVDAAQRPHLSIPETEQGKTQKHRRLRIQQSLAVVAVGATVTIAGIAVYRVYARRKDH